MNTGKEKTCHANEDKMDGLRRRGKRSKTWTGYWFEYILDDGIEKRVGPKSKVLGNKADMTKGDAKDALKEHLKTVLVAGGGPKVNAHLKTAITSSK
jgi:hypothetical protein